jgi:hypothetical protein
MGRVVVRLPRCPLLGRFRLVRIDRNGGADLPEQQGRGPVRLTT